MQWVPSWFISAPPRYFAAGVTVAWEMTEYSVQEEDQRLEVCVVLSGVTGETGTDIWVNISASDGSAEGECKQLAGEEKLTQQLTRGHSWSQRAGLIHS